MVALKGLAQLTSLTQLQFNVSHELEVLALADAVKHVEVLKLWLCPTAGLDWACLLPLGKLITVKSVHCCVCVPPPSKHVVEMLLSGLAHARSVTLTASAVNVAVVQEAVDESRAMGLDLPEKAVVLSCEGCEPFVSPHCCIVSRLVESPGQSAHLVTLLCVDTWNASLC